MATPKNEQTGIVTLDTNVQPTEPTDQQTIEQTAQAFQVANDEDFKVAGEMIVRAGQHISTVESFFEGTEEEPGIKVLAHRTHKAICDKITALTKPWRQVRIHLEPRMKDYIRKKDEERRAEEERAAREQKEREAKLLAEAERIVREAEAKALAMKRAGQMTAAKEVVSEAATQAQEVVATSEEIGVIVPDNTPKADGVGSSRPWTGRVTDAMQTIKSVAAGSTPLMWTIPKRGGGEEVVPLLVVNEAVVKYLGKRLGRENIGIPGCVGERDLGLRFSKASSFVDDPHYEPQATEPTPNKPVDW